MTDTMRGPEVAPPVGTQVLTNTAIARRGKDADYPAGTVGTIIAVPAEAGGQYWVRLLDGTKVSLTRGQFGVRKKMGDTDLRRPVEDRRPDQFGRVIYRCVVGSRAYGLDEPGSDYDRRGIYLPYADRHWSLYGVPEQLEDQENQECYWEIQKFLTLALRANPNILECMYTPLVEEASPLAQELLDMRSAFLSLHVYQTYNGYVASQFKKLEQDLRARGAFRWKHAMHLIRLLISGITALREGFVPVRVEEHRESLLAIRRGEVSWEEVNGWRLSLHKEFDEALATTRLPEKPDYERANTFLLKARRTALLEADRW